MKHLGIIILLLIAGPGFIKAGDFDEIIARGNQHYLDGEYEQAAQEYQSIVDSGFASAELYYNLGNAYYKSHRITMALVNYERAHILKPKDPEIIHNLEVAREFVTDRIEVLPEFFLRRAWIGFVKVFDADVWAIISLCSFFSALFLFLVYLFAHRLGWKRTAFWTAVIALFISLSTLLIAGQQEKLVTSHNQAIILTPSVAIKSSPDENSGTDLFLLHEGTRVTIADQLGGWREVVLTDGNRGWLKETDLISL